MGFSWKGSVASKKNWLPNAHFSNIVEVKQQMAADLSFQRGKKGTEKTAAAASKPFTFIKC